ncbi:MAG: DUF2335 domain-containing protein [bacterium]
MKKNIPKTNKTTGNHSPEDNNDSTQQINKITHSIGIWSGPLPPPEILKKYNEINPSFAERMLVMTEKEQGNRHFSNFLGQITAFIVVITALICVTYLGLKGEQWLGAGVGIIVFGSIVGAYMYTVKPKKNKDDQPR